MNAKLNNTIARVRALEKQATAIFLHPDAQGLVYRDAQVTQAVIELENATRSVLTSAFCGR